MNANFYQENASARLFKYEPPSSTGIWMMLRATSVETDGYGEFTCKTGLIQSVPADHQIVVCALPGFVVVSFKSDLSEIVLRNDDEQTLEIGDVIAHYIVAKVATLKKVNSKKDL